MRAFGDIKNLSTSCFLGLFVVLLHEYQRYSIKFKFICKALFTIQSLQSSFTGNYVSTIYLYIIFIYNIYLYIYIYIYVYNTYIFNLWKHLVILYYSLRFGIICSQVFGHLGSFKGWIQTEASVIPSYHGISRNRETNRDIISIAVVPSNQKLFVQPKLKHNNVRLIRYNCITRF